LAYFRKKPLILGPDVAVVLMRVRSDRWSIAVIYTFGRSSAFFAVFARFPAKIRQLLRYFKSF
jgi:hypothetical protein